MSIKSLVATIGGAVAGAVAVVLVQMQWAPIPSMQMSAESQMAPAAEEPAKAPAEAAADADAPTEETGEVIAVVNGQNLYEADLIAFVQSLPPQLQSQVQMLMPQILDQLVNNALSTEAGRAAGLAEDAAVLGRVHKVEDLVIGQTYLQRKIEERVTDEKVEAAYQTFLVENPPQRELQARHILVASAEEAEAVIARLDGGDDFAEVAKELSTGPSGVNGGELPPFQAGQMVPAFSDAAFALEVGTYSKAPVETQFGFHVILVEDSRMIEPPAKEEVEAQLRDQLSQEAVGEIHAELREGAAIEIILGQEPAEGTSGGTSPASGEADPDNPPSGTEGSATQSAPDTTPVPSGESDPDNPPSNN
jgi:peptidyl-prolyl cis-trans isomerase C